MFFGPRRTPSTALRTLLGVALVALGIGRCACDADLVRAVLLQLEAKQALLVAEGESLWPAITLQKKLNEVFVFSSVSSIRRLEENLRRSSGARLMIVVRLEEPTFGHLASAWTRMEMSSSNAWLCLAPFPPVDAMAFLERVFVPLDVRFLFATPRDDGFLISEVFQVHENASRTVRRFATWSPRGGLRSDRDAALDLFRGRRDFGGAALTFILIDSHDPFHPCNLNWNDDPLVLECMNFNIWNDFSATFNFTSDYRVLPLTHPNGTRGFTSPLLAAVRRGAAVTSMEAIVMTSQRLFQNDYLWPTSSTTFFVFTKVPPVEINFFSYLQPFGPRLWAATAAWLLGLGTIMALAMLSVAVLVGKSETRFPWDCADVYFVPFAALCGQSTDAEPSHRLLSLRMLVVVVHMAPLLLIPAYSGGLISSLANAPAVVPFTNLREFGENGRYKMISIQFSYVETFLKTDPVFRPLREKNLVASDREMPVTDEAAFRSVCDGMVSYFVDLPVYLKRPPRCKLFTMKETIGSYFASMAIPKGSPYKEIFNRILQRRYIAGIHVKELEKLALDKLQIELELQTWRSSGGLFHDAQFENAKAFALEDVLPIFTVYTVGLVLALVVLLLETGYHLRKPGVAATDRSGLSAGSDAP